MFCLPIVKLHGMFFWGTNQAGPASRHSASQHRGIDGHLPQAIFTPPDVGPARASCTVCARSSLPLLLPADDVMRGMLSARRD